MHYLLSDVIDVNNFDFFFSPSLPPPPSLLKRFQVFDFALTKEEMEILNTSGRNIRAFIAEMAIGHPEYPFDAEF
nr:unnamed protein product [Spirometra erinaceieuropaei]